MLSATGLKSMVFETKTNLRGILPLASNTNFHRLFLLCTALILVLVNLGDMDKNPTPCRQRARRMNQKTGIITGIRGLENILLQ
jgi:hypothetical protein